jgi:hypothetical protein
LEKRIACAVDDPVTLLRSFLEAMSICDRHPAMFAADQAVVFQAPVDQGDAGTLNPEHRRRKSRVGSNVSCRAVARNQQPAATQLSQGMKAIAGGDL